MRPSTAGDPRRRSVLIIDAANVVGSRPDGWWRDRGAAARRLHDRLLAAEFSYDEALLVLEGRARSGVPAGGSGPLVTVHAEADGDAAIVALTSARAAEAETEVLVVTADRALIERVQSVGADVAGPGWLLDQL